MVNKKIFKNYQVEILFPHIFYCSGVGAYSFIAAQQSYQIFVISGGLECCECICDSDHNVTHYLDYLDAAAEPKQSLLHGEHSIATSPRLHYNKSQ